MPIVLLLPAGLFIFALIFGECKKTKSKFIVAKVQRNAKCLITEEPQREEEEEDGEGLATIVRLWCFSNTNGNKT